ncbi:isoleucine--tRNA ligase [Candidatus Pacearchaeota archaeon]|nr:isoleucine--tRNA ligase [Candidatus Pacearchaeota archaeon]
MKNFAEIEEKARSVWKKKEKQIKKALEDDSGKKLFSFLEGPPTANASPGLHHLEVRTFKDIICKFKYMKGFSVPRKGGWDCHGLPVEVQIEKKLGLNSKKDIEKYGTEKFIKECRESVFSNIKDWNKSTEELAYWIDLEHPYVTMQNDYIESVWWSLKELYQKKLLYEGLKVVPFCPRCGTPLASHEVALGYKDVTEESVYIAFKIKNKPGEYILAWTTTPWTLPGNVALAVGKDIVYVTVQLTDGDKITVAKERLSVIRGDYKIIDEFKGKKLEGTSYEPLYNIKELQNKNSYKVVLADFVTTEDGTGIVHTAGMYGEEDYQLCKDHDLPLVHTVNQDGKFNNLVPQYEGKFVKSVEENIKKDLQEKKTLYRKEKITHSYPYCWRCETPLLYFAINSWFIKVSSFRDQLIKLNEEINWNPEHIKDGRFGKWLEGAKDWSLSRFKFWGTPLPIWRCSDGHDEIIGSVDELRKKTTKKFTEKEIDLHKPWIDSIKLKCKCGKEMIRITDVIDCWYDSGSASFAQFHYPFENKKAFERQFPYDFISEAIDQTRGWFYTLHVLSAILFKKPAYKNVICAGHVVDEKGEKMSKSKGNIIKPDEIISKTGIDAVRLQFCTSDAGNQKRFFHQLMKEEVIPFLTILQNCLTYYYQQENKSKKLEIEDQWILSRLHSVIDGVNHDLDNYNIHDAYKKISYFVVNDFSRNYIKLVRDRDTGHVLEEVLKNAALLLAPFAPYISEYIYQSFDSESVHLSSWPRANKNKINKNLENEFSNLFLIIENGLSERDKIKIGLKWPLREAVISASGKFSKELVDLLQSQLNVKKIEWKKSEEISVQYDTIMTPELEAEGFAREISRKVQDARKKSGFIKTDRIKLELIVTEDMKQMLENQKKFIKERTNSAEVFISVKSEKKFEKKFEESIKDRAITITFSKS